MSVDVEKIRKDTGRAIRVARVQRDLQQKELASKAGIGATHLGRLERAEIPIRVEHIVAIARALNMKPAELMPD
jgi:transcriptional regulator with XRE-family HTH domain